MSSCLWFFINFLTPLNIEAGIGGGGIVSTVWVITSEIVEVRRRAIWSQALSVTWSCSAVAGPLIGGLFSGTISLLLSIDGKLSLLLTFRD